jgi:hypothetical protein
VNKQNERITALQTIIEQAQSKREEMKNSAFEVNYSSNSNRNFLSFKIKQQHDKLKEELAEIEDQTKDIDPE